MSLDKFLHIKTLHETISRYEDYARVIKVEVDCA